MVVPFEVFQQELKNEYNRYNTNIEKKINSKIFILNSNYKDRDYLKHIRNSVAHVNFKFIGDQSIIFIDEDKNNNKKFELIVPLQYIHTILNDLYNIFKQ